MSKINCGSYSLGSNIPGHCQKCDNDDCFAHCFEKGDSATAVGFNLYYCVFKAQESQYIVVLLNFLTDYYKKFKTAILDFSER